MTQLAIRFFHVEAFSKAQVSQDVEHKIRHLISHVDASGPIITLLFVLSEQAQPSVNIGVHEDFSATQSTLRERVVDHTTFSRMNWNRSGAPRVDVVHGFGPYGVVLAFLDIALGPEDVSVR